MNQKYNLANYLLEENLDAAIEHLQESFHPNAVKKLYGEQLSKEQDTTPDDIIKTLLDKNPMPEKEYIMFMAKSWLGKRQEDLEDIAETISEVNQAKISKYTGSADILVKIKNNKISYEDVLKFLEPIRKSGSSDLDFSKYKKIVENDGYQVYEIDSFVKKPGTNQHEAFFGTEWCVRRENMFKQYKAPYYLITKGNEREALIHIPSMQFKDKMDQPITEQKYLTGIVTKLLNHLEVPYVYGDFALGFSRGYGAKDHPTTIFSDEFIASMTEMHNYKITDRYDFYNKSSKFHENNGKIVAEQKYKLKNNTLFIEYDIKFGKVIVSWYDVNMEQPDGNKTFVTEPWVKGNAIFREMPDVINDFLRKNK